MELNFDATQVAPDTGFEPIPGGWYNVQIDESEIKPTKAEGGAMLVLRFVVLDGQHINKKLWARLNIRNANPVAQNIAFGQLSAIAHAVGVLNVQDSAQLHGIPLKIKVTVKAATKDEAGNEVYAAGNEIKAYKNINEVIEGQAATGSGAPAAPAGFAAPAPDAPAPAAPVLGDQPWQQGAAPAAPAPAAPAPAAPTAAAPPAPAAPAAPVAPPAPPAGPVMTAKATTTYEAYLKAGWNDKQLIDGGLMLDPAASASVVAPAEAQTATPPWMT